MDCCTPGFPVHHQLSELAQTHVHLVKAMMFPVVMKVCESWTIKKATAAKSRQSCPTLYDPMECSAPGYPICHQFLELTQTMSIQSVVQVLCCPLFPHSMFLSIMVFSNESVLRIRWPKYWSFSFSISPSNEYSGLISFRVNWMDLLAVQGTLNTTVQKHQFFGAQLSLSEKAMAPHSSTLAWEIPWMEEPGRLQSMGS